MRQLMFKHCFPFRCGGFHIWCLENVITTFISRSACIFPHHSSTAFLFELVAAICFYQCRSPPLIAIGEHLSRSLNGLPGWRVGRPAMAPRSVELRMLEVPHQSLCDNPIDGINTLNVSITVSIYPAYQIRSEIRTWHLPQAQLVRLGYHGQPHLRYQHTAAPSQLLAQLATPRRTTGHFGLKRTA